MLDHMINKPIKLLFRKHVTVLWQIKLTHFRLCKLPVFFLEAIFGVVYAIHTQFCFLGRKTNSTNDGVDYFTGKVLKKNK